MPSFSLKAVIANRGFFLAPGRRQLADHDKKQRRHKDREER